MTVSAKVVNIFSVGNLLAIIAFKVAKCFAIFIFSDRTSDGIPEFRFFQIFSDFFRCDSVWNLVIQIISDELRSFQIISDQFYKTESQNSDHFRYT